MGIRDAEINRMIMYAKGLNIKVRFVNSVTIEDSASYSQDPYAEIIINNNKQSNKTDIILTLLHELSHHIYSMHTSEKIPDAVLLEDERLTRDDPIIAKNQRKKIYEFEANSLVNMEIIAIELGLKIAIWKIKKEMKLDTWMYEYYYEHGNFPTKKQKRLKNKELMLKYKESKE